MELTPQDSVPETPPPAVLNADAYEQFWASVESDESDAGDVDAAEAADAYEQFWRDAD